MEEKKAPGLRGTMASTMAERWIKMVMVRGIGREASDNGAYVMVRMVGGDSGSRGGRWTGETRQWHRLERQQQWWIDDGEMEWHLREEGGRHGDMAAMIGVPIVACWHLRMATGDGGKEAVGGAGRSGIGILATSSTNDEQQGSDGDCGSDQVVV